MRSDTAIATVALTALAASHTPGHSQVAGSIDDWEVIGQAESAMVRLRTLAPAGRRGKTLKQMALEYRFKGVGKEIGAGQALTMKQEGFFKSCPSAAASREEGVVIADSEAVLIRLDCPSWPKTGERKTLMMSAWIEAYDLQTKEVTFSGFVPNELDINAARAFLTKPAMAISPRK